MKISEVRIQYNQQIKSYCEQHVLLADRKKELEQKIRTTPDGVNVFANEAAILELQTNAVNEKQDEYKAYMEKLLEQWSSIANMESAKQQGEAMEEYYEDMGKIMEVARRIMKGGIVPADDEKKLMEYSMELYQAAKNMGTLAKEREEYDTLWDEEQEEGEPADPMEIADNTEAFAEGPEIVDVADTMAAAVETE